MEEITRHNYYGKLDGPYPKVTVTAQIAQIGEVQLRNMKIELFDKAQLGRAQHFCNKECPLPNNNLPGMITCSKMGNEGVAILTEGTPGQWQTKRRMAINNAKCPVGVKDLRELYPETV